MPVFTPVTALPPFPTGTQLSVAVVQGPPVVSPGPNYPGVSPHLISKAPTWFVLEIYLEQTTRIGDTISVWLQEPSGVTTMLHQRVLTLPLLKSYIDYSGGKYWYEISNLKLALGRYGCWYDQRDISNQIVAQSFQHIYNYT